VGIEGQAIEARRIAEVCSLTGIPCSASTCVIAASSAGAMFGEDEVLRRRQPELGAATARRSSPARSSGGELSLSLMRPVST
jgi:hypothetical protein